MHVTITRVLQTYAEAPARITPRSDHANSRLGDPGQPADLAHRFLVKIDDLLSRSSVGRRRNIDDQDTARIETSLLPLHRDQRRDQHAGAREQYERRRDLRNGKDVLASAG